MKYSTAEGSKVQVQAHELSLCSGATLKHLALRWLLPSTKHYWIQVLCRGTRQRPNCTRQRTHGKKLIGKYLFAECLLSGTRQRKATITAPAPRWRSLCRVPTLQALGKDFLFLFLKNSLPSALYPALGKNVLFFFLKILCRVPPGRRSAKFEFFLKKFFAECPLAGTRQSLNFFKKKFFAECPLSGTRQSLNFF